MIVKEIGVPTLLEQTAEEACELAQACLKMARKLRDENPTPVSVEDIRENLQEEICDIKVCLSLIETETNITDARNITLAMLEKLTRWQNRLDANIDDLEEL